MNASRTVRDAQAGGAPARVTTRCGSCAVDGDNRHGDGFSIATRAVDPAVSITP